MKCKNCSYALWNLSTRKCPECGTYFKPSDYDLVPNSVRFCCPHCDQHYFGTSERGHLVPASFNCVSCTQPVEMDQMVIRPVGTNDDGEVEKDVPFRSDPNRLSGFFRTIWLVMMQPRKIARGIVAAEGTAGGTLFLAAMGLVTTFIGAFLSMVLMMAMTSVLPGGAPGGPGGGVPVTGVLGVVLGTSVVFGVVMWIVIAFIWAGLTHVILSLSGAKKWTFGTTFAVIAYSSGCMVLGWIPCIGSYTQLLGMVWQFVSASVMMAEIHRATPRRAVFAILAPPLTALSLLLLSVLVLMVPLMGALQGLGKAPGVAPPPPPPPQMMAPSASTDEMQKVVNALDWYRLDRGGWPPHALALVDGSGALQPDDLMLESNAAADEDVVISGRQLWMYHMLTTQDQERVFGDAQRMLVAQGNAPYRLGDYIFCFHGTDASRRPSAWAVIQADRLNPTLPDANLSASEVLVGTAAGKILAIRTADWKDTLERENAIRTGEGLLAIPDPFMPAPEEDPDAEQQTPEQQTPKQETPAQEAPIEPQPQQPAEPEPKATPPGAL